MADPKQTSSLSGSESRFTTPQQTAEDLIKSQSIGLVQLSDFRKRRAEAMGQSGKRSEGDSGASTPRESDSIPQSPKKKPKKTLGKLSFAMDDEDESTDGAGLQPTTSKPKTNKSSKVKSAESSLPKKKLVANNTVSIMPKLMTKSALEKEGQARDELRKEFLAMQEVVKNTEIVIPFVFYDGTNLPGGSCRVKKGEHIWLFLDKARKVGAGMGVGGSASAKKGWARISVDDLVLVRGDIIIPHHYDFYYFMINKTVGYQGRLFNYSAEPTLATPQKAAEDDDETYDPLAPKKKSKGSNIPDDKLEGYGDDPSLTKVVDRRWYEKNKHIYPASLWEEFDMTKDYSKGIRKDAAGNVLFFT